MIDEVDKIIEVTVRDASGQQHAVKVLSAPYKRSPLVLELTDANMTLLSMKPLAGDDWEPAISEENVQWLAYRKSLMCHYFDVNGAKWRKHVMKVKADFDDKEAFQEATDRLARVMQEYFNQHHTEPDEF
eukprot:5578557-Pyramimonas_sp.AAC.1